MFIRDSRVRINTPEEKGTETIYTCLVPKLLGTRTCIQYCALKWILLNKCTM